MKRYIFILITLSACFVTSSQKVTQEKPLEKKIEIKEMRIDSLFALFSEQRSEIDSLLVELQRRKAIKKRTIKRVRKSLHRTGTKLIKQNIPFNNTGSLLIDSSNVAQAVHVERKNIHKKYKRNHHE